MMGPVAKAQIRVPAPTGPPRRYPIRVARLSRAMLTAPIGRRFILLARPISRVSRGPQPKEAILFTISLQLFYPDHNLIPLSRLPREVPKHSHFFLCYTGHYYTSQFSFSSRFFHQYRKIPVMPLRCWFLTVDIMEETCGYFFLSQVLLNTKSTTLIMIYRMIRTFIICTGTELYCIFHLAASITSVPAGVFSSGTVGSPSIIPSSLI